MKKLSLVFTLMLFSIITMLAQRAVTGMVTDQGGEALIGASVLVKGTSSGTITDIEGKYSVNVPDGSKVLVVSYTGFVSQEIELGASNIVNIELAEGVTLETAVVTALGITKSERSIGYAVQEVKGDEVAGANESNLVQALAGKVAGLNVTNSSGAAGGSSYFTIRGVNTISGNNQPLIVVDGVPIDNSQLRSGSAVASVAYSNRAIDINQSEIANVSVLKGAAATALYGSQAGNGAVIITTKKGASSKGKVSVDFSQDVTFSNISQVPDLQTTYAQGVFGNYSGPETGSGYSYGPAIADLVYADDAGDYAWDKNGSLVSPDAPNATSRAANTYDRFEYFQTGINSNTSLAVATSSENSNIRFSAGYNNSLGVIPQNTFNKVNFGLNADTKLSDKISIGLGVQYINSGGTRIEQGSNTSGVMLGLLRTTPTFDNSNGYEDAQNEPLAYSFEDGSQRNYRGGGGYDNPYWTSNNNPLNDKVNRVIGNINLSYKVNDWMTLTYRPGIDFYSDFRSQYFALGSRTNPAGLVFEDQYFNTRFNADLLATFQKDLTPDLSGSLIVGHNMRSRKLENLYSQAQSLVIPGFYDLSNGTNISTSKDVVQSRNQAGFASLDLNYKRMLYLTLTGRLESSTILPEENNTYGYGSAGLSLIFSEFMDNKDVLSFGKIRGSYGTVGLGGAGFEYATANYFAGTNVGDGWTNFNIIQFPYNGVSAFSFDDLLGNPDLRPEKNRTIELGADLRFFQNRLGLDVTYYNSLATDIIIAVPVASTSGYRNLTKNAASLSNKGFEIVLNATPVKRALTWDLGVNFTRNRNTVEALSEGVDNVPLGGFTGATTRAVAGQPYGAIYGFGFYRDAEGNKVIGSDGFPILDPTEKAFASAQPDFTVGIRNSLTYKGLTLSALLDIKQGGVMWNGTKSALYFWGTHQETADIRNTAQVFAGTNASYNDDGSLALSDHDNDPSTPDVVAGNGENTTSVLIDENWLAFGNANGFFGDNTEDFIESTSWVRLRDVSLSYVFPRSFFNDKIQGLNIAVSGRNLFLRTPYTGVDPDTNLYGASNAQGLDYFNMPGTKSYTVSLKASF